MRAIQSGDSVAFPVDPCERGNVLFGSEYLQAFVLPAGESGHDREGTSGLHG
jgi:hypothetical protein